MTRIYEEENMNALNQRGEIDLPNQLKAIPPTLGDISNNGPEGILCFVVNQAQPRLALGY